MEAVIATFYHIMGGMTHFALLFLGLILAKLVYKWTTPYNFNAELTEKDNPAIGVSLGGYLLGAALALSGAVFDAEITMLEDLLEILLVVVATVILMRLSLVINDLAILYKFKINKEMVADRNVGVGFVVAGSSIATGLMLNGVLNGHSPSLALAIRDICVYWAVGQALLVAGGFFFQAITSYDVHGVIGDQDNLPAGISFGGFLVAQGIITRNALFGATSHLLEEILTTLTLALFGLILLLMARIISDRVLLPNSPLAKEVVVDRNPAAGAIAAVSFIMVALLFCAAVNPSAAAKTVKAKPAISRGYQP